MRGKSISKAVEQAHHCVVYAYWLLALLPIRSYISCSFEYTRLNVWKEGIRHQIPYWSRSRSSHLKGCFAPAVFSDQGITDVRSTSHKQTDPSPPPSLLPIMSNCTAFNHLLSHLTQMLKMQVYPPFVQDISCSDGILVDLLPCGHHLANQDWHGLAQIG